MTLAFSRPQEGLPLTDQPRRARHIHRERLPNRQERERGRTQARAAREHAESWYQALRIWDAAEDEVPVPKVSYWIFRDGFDEGTVGEHGAIPLTTLNTPIGQIKEAEVARRISEWAASPVPEQRAMGKLLDQLRKNLRAPRSLIRDDGGWAPRRQVSAGYALACLTLAVQFGDREAEQHLTYCRAAMGSVLDETETKT